MADVKVKLFGQYRLDAGWAERRVSARTLGEVFPALSFVPDLVPANVLIYLNGQKVRDLRTPLSDDDELWLMGSASGG